MSAYAGPDIIPFLCSPGVCWILFSACRLRQFVWMCWGLWILQTCVMREESTWQCMQLAAFSTMMMPNLKAAIRASQRKTLPISQAHTTPTPRCHCPFPHHFFSLERKQAVYKIWSDPIWSEFWLWSCACFGNMCHIIVTYKFMAWILSDSKRIMKRHYLKEWDSVEFYLCCNSCMQHLRRQALCFLLWNFGE